MPATSERREGVVVIGGGVIGCAVARALSTIGVATTILEALPRLAGGASGANSGILHTGFDSVAGELETILIRRAAELREGLLERLGIPLMRCGAHMRPRDARERAAVLELHANATAAGVETTLDEDGALSVPGEAVTDPVVFTEGLARAARGAGAVLRLGARVTGIEPGADGASVAIGRAEGSIAARAVVNCAGLFADEVAAMVGEERFQIYPRKGEFLVFRQPAGQPLERILLPIPSALGKGVLVFPTLDGHVIAGPSAREREDKEDWSVESDARELILERAHAIFPPLAAIEPVAAYAGLRPAGRGANYVIEFSCCLPQMLHVAAIRSTGLSASLGIAERVVEMLAARGLITPGAARAVPQASAAGPEPPWWRRAAARSGAKRGETAR